LLNWGGILFEGRSNN